MPALCCAGLSSVLCPKAGICAAAAGGSEHLLTEHYLHYTTNTTHLTPPAFSPVGVAMCTEGLLCAVQGQAQCCVTGPAFEQLLQQEDLSLVETVMRNVTVFARMRPHQKGQVMDLLGSRGLHQMHRGHPRTIPVSLLQNLYMLSGLVYVCVHSVEVNAWVGAWVSE